MWILDALPKKYKPRAFSLLRYIKRNYNMKWTPNGTFKYKNVLIPDSNILHLIVHALLKKVPDKPPGMKEFYQGLSEINVPEFLVKSVIGKKLITASEEDDDWGPTGELFSGRKKKQKIK